MEYLLSNEPLRILCASLNGSLVTGEGDHMTTDDSRMIGEGDHVTTGDSHMTGDGGHMTTDDNHLCAMKGSHHNTGNSHVTTDDSHVISCGCHMTRELLILMKYTLQHCNSVTTAPPHPDTFSTSHLDATPTRVLTTPTLEANNVMFLMDLFRECSLILLDTGAAALKTAHSSPVTEQRSSCDNEEEGRVREEGGVQGVDSMFHPLDFTEVRDCLVAIC